MGRAQQSRVFGHDFTWRYSAVSELALGCECTLSCILQKHCMGHTVERMAAEVMNNQRQSVGADFKDNGLSLWKKHQREEANS
ncbi:hypothetical protein CapIbe_004746 [Capra ibex]